MNHEFGRMVMEFGNDQEPWSPKIDSSELVLVHCTTSLFNGNENMDVFDLDQQLSLAFLDEAARIKNTLDMAFARRLCPSENKSDNEVLRTLITAFSFANGDAGSSPIKSMLTLAVILAIGNEDPKVVYDFIKQNRLSMFNIQGLKLVYTKRWVSCWNRPKAFKFVSIEFLRNGCTMTYYYLVTVCTSK
jgi:hypothetical protein